MNYFWTLLVGIILIAGCGKNSTTSKWVPPQNPKPDKILDEAEADTRTGNYADALAKEVWFFQNALKYDPAETGVRLSFALDSWADLGQAYPPALDKLKAIRDEAEQNVHQGKDALNNCIDLIAINDALKDYDKTLEIFVWLDANNSALARTVFSRSQHYLLPALIKSKQYQLCGKYIDANASMDKILQIYRYTMKHAIDSDDTSLKNFENQYLVNQTTTLIAVLTITGRKADAQQIVDRISKEPNLPEFKSEIEKALNGEIPSQSP
jgi:tetratricopeptide (TPR) repeat protein